MNKRKTDTKKLVLLSLFTALVVVMQCIPIKISTFELALSVPIIIIGAAVCGFPAGAWLGLVFGVVTLFLPGTAAYLSFHTFGTVVTVIVKSVGAGIVAAVVYKPLERINRYLAAIASAIATTVTNTGIFLIGSLLFFGTDFRAVIEVLISVNFLIELCINIALVPTVVRIINIKKH